MNFLQDFGISNLLTLGLALLAGFGTLITMRGKVEDAKKTADDAKTRADKAIDDLNAFKLTTAQDYVRMTTLREVKEDLTKEIKEIEHVIRNTLMGYRKSGSP